jgi:two-component system alkaline phosphatase synthesis response regulator PhoP
MTRKKRILIVDDEKSLTNLLKLNLEETGSYEVRTENWAEDAFPAAREFKPDLVLLDIIMPRMPGGDVVAQFRNDPELKSTPIVFVTAAIAPHIVEEMEGKVPTAFDDLPCLAKPVTLEKVIETIEKYARQPA